MSDLSQLQKRGGQSLAPDELTLITDPKDPLYDKRMERPIEDGDILNIAAMGYVQPITVRLRDGKAIPVDGIQRTKRGLVINHIVGRTPYTGKLEPVLAAIARLATSAIGKRIIELCPDGVKVPISIYRGNDKEALGAKVSANAYRDNDPLREIARKAQQLAKHGHDNDQIGELLRVKDKRTVERYLAMDVDKERAPRKARTKKAKPTAKRVSAVLAKGEEWNITEREKMLLEWTLGKTSIEALVKEFPEFKDVK